MSQPSLQNRYLNNSQTPNRALKPESFRDERVDAWSPVEKAATVLLIVGDNLVHQMLAINLRHNGLLPIHEKDVGKACEALLSVKPDLIVFDPECAPKYRNMTTERLYDYAGTYAIPVIALNRSDSGPMPLSGKTQVENIAKPFSPRKLLDTILSLLQKDSVTSQEVCQIGQLSLNPRSFRVYHGNTEIPLHTKEFLVLALLMKHADHVFNRNRLLDELWSYDTEVDERAVDVAICRLRAALEPYGLSGRIETIRGAGYRFCV